MAIQDILNKLSSELFMKDMRQHMIDGLNQVYKDAIFKGDTNMEVVRSRDAYPSLYDRLNASDDELAQTYKDLDNKKVDLSYFETIIASLSSGGPSGLFYSISALKESYPDGQPGTYLVFDSTLIDGAHSFIWEGNSWVDIGVYQAKEVAKKAVTLEKIGDDFRKDLYADVIHVPLWSKGSLDGSTGVAKESGTDMRTELIKVDTFLSIELLNGDYNYIIYFYKKNGAYSHRTFESQGRIESGTFLLNNDLDVRILAHRKDGANILKLSTDDVIISILVSPKLTGELQMSQPYIVDWINGRIEFKKGETLATDLLTVSVAGKRIAVKTNSNNKVSLTFDVLGGNIYNIVFNLKSAMLSIIRASSMVSNSENIVVGYLSAASQKVSIFGGDGLSLKQYYDEIVSGKANYFGYDLYGKNIKFNKLLTINTTDLPVHVPETYQSVCADDNFIYVLYANGLAVPSGTIQKYSKDGMYIEQITGKDLFKPNDSQVYGDFIYYRKKYTTELSNTTAVLGKINKKNWLEEPEEIFSLPENHHFAGLAIQENVIYFACQAGEVPLNKIYIDSYDLTTKSFIKTVEISLSHEYHGIQGISVYGNLFYCVTSPYDNTNSPSFFKTGLYMDTFALNGKLLNTVYSEKFIEPEGIDILDVEGVLFAMVGHVGKSGVYLTKL